MLPDELGSDVSRLLETSRWNRALVEGADDADASLTDEEQSRLLRRIHSEHRRTSNHAWTWRWQTACATAALVVFVAGTTWMLWRQRPASPSPSNPEAQIAVANPPPAPSYLLPLDKPQIKVSAAALTFRGPSGENRLLADLKSALDALRMDDYQAAARELTRLGDAYPLSVEVPYYLGVSRLFLNDPPGALAALARAESLADSSFEPDIAWYQAVASERAGQRDVARARLAALCKQLTPRSPDACVAEQNLK